MIPSAKFNRKIIFRICVLLTGIGFLYFLPDIAVSLFLAFILALTGKPLAKWISRIKIYKWRVPYSVGAVISTLFFLTVVLLLIGMFVPLLIQELRNMENIDYETLTLYLEDKIAQIQTFLYDKEIMNSNTTVVSVITDEIRNIVNADLISNILGGFINMTSSFVIALFTIFFTGFFFMKDDIRLDNLVRPFVSETYTGRLSIVSEKINHLLSRYCIGLTVRILIMILLIYIGFLICGIPGAGLHAFIGGILNIIPYLGPLIGAFISIFLGFINCVSTEAYTQIIPFIIEIAAIYVVVNVIDYLVLQPYIFSQSVNIHAVEVFLVTIIGGKVAGIPGMILAIPVYTILRTMVIEIYRYVNQDG
jgi:predicted PurR-regulated permease PerM